MPVIGFWDDETQIIYRIEMVNQWTWSEFRQQVQAAYDAISALNYDVNLVMGFYSKFPEGSALEHLLYAGGNQPPNLRHTAVLNRTGLSEKLLMQSLIESVDRINEWAGPEFVESMDEARVYFASQSE